MRRLGLAWFLTVISVSTFAIGLTTAQQLRLQYSWLMLALPLTLIGVVFDQLRPQFLMHSREAVRALVDGTPSAANRWVSGPLLIGLTWLNHLLGASVGREGVGLQLGDWASRILQFNDHNARQVSQVPTRLALATGFAVLFGAPLTAVVFIFESLQVAKPRVRMSGREAAGLLCATFVGDSFARLLGVEHDSYVAWSWLAWMPSAALRMAFFLFALIFASAAAALFFAVAQKKLQLIVVRLLGLPFRVGPHPVKPLLVRERILGALVLVLVLFILGRTFEQLGANSPFPGLGLTGMGALRVFHDPGLVYPLQQPLVIAFVKLILTAFFVGLGLRGGEVTPLLVAGAALAVGLIHAVFPSTAEATELSRFAIPLGGALIWSTVARRPLTGAVLAVEVFTSGFFVKEALLSLALLPLVAGMAWLSLQIYDFGVRTLRGVLPQGFHASLYEKEY